MSSRLMRVNIGAEAQFIEKTDRRAYPYLMNVFDTAVHQKITEFIEKHEAPSRQRKIAVFDADGTLWRGDVGEDFFKFQIEKQWLRKKIENPLKAYFDEVEKGDPVKAYGWLAQWNAGASEEDMRRWSHEFFHEKYSKAIFEPMRLLTHSMMNAGFEVWIVSASPYWAVMEGAKGFGVQPDRIIAVKTKTEKGILTDELAYPVPYRHMKMELVNKIIGDPPLFAAGNTFWDKELLSMATEMTLSINSEDQDGPNYKAEQDLRQLADSMAGKTPQWLTQRF